MYWTKPLQGVWVWVLIGEWVRNGKNKSLAMAKTCIGRCDSESCARPPLQYAGVLGRLHLVVTGVSQHDIFDSKRSSFWSERFGFVHGRSRSVSNSR